MWYVVSLFTPSEGTDLGPRITQQKSSLLNKWGFFFGGGDCLQRHRKLQKLHPQKAPLPLPCRWQPTEAAQQDFLHSLQARTHTEENFPIFQERHPDLYISHDFFNLIHFYTFKVLTSILPPDRSISIPSIKKSYLSPIIFYKHSIWTWQLRNVFYLNKRLNKYSNITTSPVA